MCSLSICICLVRGVFNVRTSADKFQRDECSFVSIPFSVFRKKSKKGYSECVARLPFNIVRSALKIYVFSLCAVSVFFCDSTIANTRVEALNSGLSAHQKQFFISSVHLFSSRHESLEQNGKSINYIPLRI